MTRCMIRTVCESTVRFKLFQTQQYNSAVLNLTAGK